MSSPPTAISGQGQPLILLTNEAIASQQRGEYYPHIRGWTFDIFFRRKSLLQMLEEFEEEGRAENEDLVCNFFDGGETVIFKVGHSHFETSNYLELMVMSRFMTMKVSKEYSMVLTGVIMEGKVFIK